MTPGTWIETFVLVGALAAADLRAADRTTAAAPARERHPLHPGAARMSPASPAREAETGVVPAVSGAGAILGAAVRDARALALDRIDQRQECRQLFTEHGADGARLLLSADYRQAAPGEAGGLCEKGAAAFTGMRSGRTALCADSFLKLGRHYGAVVLLHEALHVAGLGQHPHHPGGETPQQIDRRVRRSCGL